MTYPAAQVSLDRIRAMLCAMSGYRISTHYDPKPIPIRGFDWSAVDDATYDGEGCPIGYGATEAEAVPALLEQLENE